MMTLNGMFSQPKPHRINFIKENKKKLKQIASLVNPNVKTTNTDIPTTKSSQTDVVGRQVHSSSSKLIPKQISSGKLSKKSTITVFMRDRRKDDVSSSTALFPNNKSSHRGVSVTKHQSCQTIDPKNYDQLFHEGTILYPSSKVMDEIAEVEKQKANRLDAHVKKDFFKKNRIKSRSPSKTLTKVSVSPGDQKNESKESTTSSEEEKKQMKESNSQPEAKHQSPPPPPAPAKKKESVVKVMSKPKMKESNPPLNAAEIIRKTTEDHLHYSPRSKQLAQSSQKILPSNRGDSNPSHIPKVTKKSASKRSKREEEVLKTVLDPMCPPGHIPLPDQERKKTLHMLRVSYAELIREMNLLPVRTDTLRIRQRKIQLENQLNKIEEGIKVFNKSKVYVKIEE